MSGIGIGRLFIADKLCKKILQGAIVGTFLLSANELQQPYEIEQNID